jgi:hypothetical protein
MLYFFHIYNPMQHHTPKLAELQKQLKQIVKDANSDKLTKKEAADKILAIKEEMETIIESLRNDPVKHY